MSFQLLICDINPVQFSFFAPFIQDRKERRSTSEIGLGAHQLVVNLAFVAVIAESALAEKICAWLRGPHALRILRFFRGLCFFDTTFLALVNHVHNVFAHLARVVSPIRRCAGLVNGNKGKIGEPMDAPAMHGRDAIRELIGQSLTPASQDLSSCTRAKVGGPLESRGVDNKIELV